jgi:hypothetical protein
MADANNAHLPNEAIQLDRNRHATCADCHNSHASEPTVTFTSTPDLRAAQLGVTGVSLDGSAKKLATLQYENCLRCHSESVGKQALPVFGYLPARALFPGDTLNVRLQMGTSALSAHPVMKDARGGSQPSLLDAMLDLSGQVKTRPMGTRLLCTDCHNSDNNREFGGTGPNGPHGSKNSHMLEREYIQSQVAPGVFPAGGPGSLIMNLSPSPLLTSAAGAPYALCAKCHDLSNVNSNVSFQHHSSHIQKGVSCSVCHSSHGVPAGTTGVAGDRLVSFDMNVVGTNNGVVNYSNGTCTLTCHMTQHNGATVTPIQ